MKAKKENIVNKNRHELYQVVPLETPYSLFVDICNACNFKCKFCAIQYSDRKLNFRKQCMEWELYEKIICDLKEFPHPLKMMRLTANGEPLVNKRLPDMIRLAKETGVTEHIEIVTNGSLLNPVLNRELVDAGLDRIRISIEEISAEGYFNMAGVKLDWDSFLNNIQDLYNTRHTNGRDLEIYIKTVDAAVNTKEKEKQFFELFGNMCDKISVEHVIPIWTGYDEINNDFNIEQEEGLHGHGVRDVDICPFPFYSFVINPDGEITACCNDWERKISFGYVQEKSLYNLWNGEEYHSFLTGMISKGRKKNHPEGCAKCKYPCFDAVDNLDPYKFQLLEKFNEKYSYESK